jgi:hypothetical protein
MDAPIFLIGAEEGFWLVIYHSGFQLYYEVARVSDFFAVQPLGLDLLCPVACECLWGRRENQAKRSCEVGAGLFSYKACFSAWPIF